MRSSRILLCAFIAGTVFNTGGAAFAQTVGTTGDSELSALESRFFHHSYQKETMNARITRLESFVFGGNGASQGTAQDRLSSLIRATADDPNDPHHVDVAMREKLAADFRAKQAADPSSYKGAYPRLQQLERQMTGSTHENQPVADRISTLEKLAYGHASGDSDLARRVDHLEHSTRVATLSAPVVLPAQSVVPRSNSYAYTMKPSPSTFANSSNAVLASYEEDAPAQSIPHYRSVQQAAFNVAASQFASSAQTASRPAATVTDKIEVLEKLKFGKIFAGKTLDKRVEKLESVSTLTANSNQSSDLSARVERLWNTSLLSRQVDQVQPGV